MIHLKNFDSFIVSENLKYHLDNEISIVDNVFRPGSDAFLSMLKEVRTLYDTDRIILEDFDSELFEYTDIGRFALYNDVVVPLDLPMLNEEAEYKGREVELNKPMRSSGPKKYKVYVKNPETGNVKVVHFGDVKGGLTSKVNDPVARKSFAKRHDCKNKKDKMKPSYWSCRLPKFKNLVNTDFSGYW